MHWYGPLILGWIYGLTRINDTYLYANQTVEQILNNHYKNSDWKVNEEKEYKLYKSLKEEKEKQIFNNPAKVRNDEQPDGNVTPTIEEIKLISFEGGTETILKIFNALCGFFPEREAELRNVLGGKHLNEPLLFQGKCNQFVEVFRRLKYNHLIVSNYREIRDWICLNFAFKGIHNIEDFKKSTVYDILKGKFGTEPTKKQRILQDLDWLPYICSEKLAARNNMENIGKTIPPKYPKSI